MTVIAHESAHQTQNHLAFRQRATRGDQDVNAELMQAVEEIDEGRVLEALAAGANADPWRNRVVGTKVSTQKTTTI